MQIENIYPEHTSKEDWMELALLSSKLLTAMAAALQEAEDKQVSMEGGGHGSHLCPAIPGQKG